MAEMGTATVPETTGADETTGVTEVTEETTTSEEVGEATGQEGEEKTPEQIEDEKAAAAIEASKKKTDEAVQRRIDKEGARRKRAEEEREYWRGKAEALAERGASKTETTIQATDTTLVPPDPENYENGTHDQKYLADLMVFGGKKALAEHESTVKRNQQETAAKTAQEEWSQSVDAMVAKGQEEFDDFDEVTDGKNLKLTPVMVQAIMDTGDMAHRIEYHLGTNKDLAQKIVGMKPLQQMKEIIKLEDTLRAASVKTTTKALPPVTTVDGKSQAAKDWTDPNLNEEERIAQIRARRLAGRR